MKAVTDLTASECSARDAAMKAPEGVFCQSVGSKLNKASGGRFPLNFHIIWSNILTVPTTASYRKTLSAGGEIYISEN